MEKLSPETRRKHLLRLIEQARSLKRKEPETDEQRIERMFKEARKKS